MANNPELLKMPLARDGQKSTIPETTDASTGLFSQQYGWQSINSLPPQAGGKAVKREDFNGAFNLLGGIAYYAQKGFTFKWSADQDYYAGCVVIDDTDGWRYECIADVTANNTAPSADTTHWQIFSAGTDLDAWFRQASTVYAVGDMRCYESLPYGWYLDCTTAGTTGSGDITIPSPLNVGDTVTDGTVVWTIRKISSSDGVPLGAIIPLAHNSTLPAGYLLCDGSAVSRTMYPDLFSLIGTTYGAGDGSTTFNVPDYNSAKRFAQGDTVAGIVKQAGLPNITGTGTRWGGNSSAHGLVIDEATGALKTVKTTTSQLLGSTAYGGEKFYTDDFDASLSNSIYGNSTTVQPDALTARYIIKAFDGQTPASALIDITQYANELAGKADRSLSNLTQDGEDHFIENDFTIIYPNGGSEASPANVTINSRYVESNPFPGYRVRCEAELQYNGNWGSMNNSVLIYGSGSNNGCGISALQLNDDNIVIQTGNSTLLLNSSTTGNPFTIPQGIAVTSPLPCRVKVWKIGKIPTA